MFILWLCESQIDIMNLNQETQDIIGLIKQRAGGSVILYHKHTGIIAYYHKQCGVYMIKTVDC